MGVGRRITAPLRGYFNEHFEMVKHEIRVSAAPSAADPGAAVAPAAAADRAAWERLAEVENAIAEMSAHETRALVRLTDSVAELSARVADVERIVAQLADVVGAAFTRQPE